MKRKLIILAAVLAFDVFLACICAGAAADFLASAPDAACRTQSVQGRTEKEEAVRGKEVGSAQSGWKGAEPAQGGFEEAGSAQSGLKEAEPGPDSFEEAPGGAGEKLIALTFDDGPHPVYTKKLLDGLKERHVKASFFLIGESIPGNEELVRQMAQDGHLVGTHCYSHEDLTKMTPQEAIEDITRTNEMIREISGQLPDHIRPPYGRWSDDLEAAVGMTPVFWDIDTLDWQSQNAAKVERQIYKNVGRHQVVLLHDVFDTSVEAALTVVDTLAAQGYTFVTVDELLID